MDVGSVAGAGVRLIRRLSYPQPTGGYPRFVTKKLKFCPRFVTKLIPIAVGL
jgi:hypothetical protein